jgi:hypothetical protein
MIHSAYLAGPPPWTSYSRYPELPESVVAREALAGRGQVRERRLSLPPRREQVHHRLVAIDGRPPSPPREASSPGVCVRT